MTGNANNFLKEIRDAAMTIPSAPHRDAVRALADDIQECIDALAANATAISMIHLNAAWSRAAMALRIIEQNKPPTSTGGALKDGALLQERAA